MLRAYIQAVNLSHAMMRVSQALTTHAPQDIIITSEKDKADLILVHTIGYPETIEEMDRLLAAKKRYIVAQYCMRTTQRPHTSAWLPIWKNAEFVWSYYDLPTMMKADGVIMPSEMTFYRSPLGVDSMVFIPPSLEEHKREFIMLTSGYVAESEGVREAVQAAEETDKYIIHLGPDLQLGNRVQHFLGISDHALAKWYRACQFVAGLRRGEGFELPAAEGLLCGARPVCFDRPHYRDWYDDFAEFIPESDFHTVRDHLVGLFREGARPVTQDEIRLARMRFSWKNIAEGFWNHVKVHV